MHLAEHAQRRKHAGLRVAVVRRPLLFQGERRVAVRVSDYESIDTALRLAGSVGWVWVDSFQRFPLDGAQASKLTAAGFKLCLVSPELQGRVGSEQIPALRQLLRDEGIVADAVCTKHPERWEP